MPPLRCTPQRQQPIECAAAIGVARVCLRKRHAVELVSFLLGARQALVADADTIVTAGELRVTLHRELTI